MDNRATLEYTYSYVTAYGTHFNGGTMATKPTAQQVGRAAASGSFGETFTGVVARVATPWEEDSISLTLLKHAMS